MCLLMSTTSIGFRVQAAAWTLALSVAAGSLALAEEPKKPVDPPKLTAGGEGFALQSASGDYRLQLRGYVQFFSRYGESLIDYNWNQTTIGAGIALSDGM